MARYKQRQVLPGVDKTLSNATKASAGTQIKENDLIAVTSQNGAFLSVVQADADTILHAHTRLMVADFGVASGTIGSFALPWKVLDGLNTSALSVGDPVYLSDTAGIWSGTPGTFRIPVGIVTEDHATTGRILLCPQDMPRTITGILAISSATTGTVTFDAALDGSPVTATANENSTGRYVKHVEWNGSGVLTVTMSGTYDGDVGYSIGV